MHRRWISGLLLFTYSAALIKLLVFKITLLKIGHLRFRFAPEVGEGNFLPFKTIASYLRGEPRWSIAMLNLVGNIALFVPVGFLIPLVFRRLNWPVALLSAVAVGLSIETAQVILHVGIFDIDDVILNALGVVIGLSLAPRAALAESASAAQEG